MPMQIVSIAFSLFIKVTVSKQFGTISFCTHTHVDSISQAELIKAFRNQDPDVVALFNLMGTNPGHVR
jgi:hypothetical protein